MTESKHKSTQSIRTMDEGDIFRFHLHHFVNFVINNAATPFNKNYYVFQRFNGNTAKLAI